MTDTPATEATPKSLAAQKRKKTLEQKKAIEEGESRLAAIAQQLPPAWAATDEERISLVKSAYGDILGLDKKGNPRPFTDLRYFLFQAAQRNLNPFKKQIHATYIWDSSKGGEQLVVITGIDGFRAVAQRSKRPLYAGSNEPEFTWTDGEDPKLVAAKVEVCAYNPITGNREVIATGVARYDEYVKMVDEYENVIVNGEIQWENGKPKRKKTGKQVVNSTWQKMPTLMLAKCAEAIALRKGFPEDLGGLYVKEEIDHMQTPVELNTEDDSDMRAKISAEVAKRKSLTEGEVVE